MKRNALQILMTAILAFAFTGAFAQVEGGDYTVYDTEKETPTNVEYVTAGATMGYYAEPDPVYHPDYNAAATTPWTLTADFTWNWTLDGADVAYDNVTEGTPANYVEITFPSADTYVVTAQEEAPTTFGGCAGTTTTMNVTALPVPTADVAGSNNDGWDVTTADHSYYRCGDATAAESVTITITETGVPLANASYAFAVKRNVYNVDVDGNTVGATITDDYAADYAIGAPGASTKYATGTADGGSLVIDAGTMTVENNLRTVYEYVLQKPTDAAGAATDGIVSAISHKSDYLTYTDVTDVTTYDFADMSALTVTYIVNPQPATGPIYHISNDWAL